MVIKEIKYFPKELIFKTPFQTSQTTYTKKKIFIVELKDELNNTGIGECAPLSEFGTETIEQAEKKILELKNYPSQFSFNDFINRENTKPGCHSLSRYFFIGRPFRDKKKLSVVQKTRRFSHGMDRDCQVNNSIIEQIENAFSEFFNFPSLRFAFEQALFTLFSKREKNFFQNFYKTNYKKSININGVVGFKDPKNIIENINFLLNEGFNTIKLKCGRENFKDDFQVIDSVRKHFGNKINLRIDVNGKWSFEEAKNNLEELKVFNLEYAEQPVNTKQELIELSKISNVKIAADESVKNFEDAKYLLENGIKILVVKPTAAGGILNTIKIINEAEKHNANIIISSSFESAAGKSVLVYLASLTNHNYAHGLGTGNLFEQNICEDVYPVKNGIIDFDINNYPPEFNF